MKELVFWLFSAQVSWMLSNVSFVRKPKPCRRWKPRNWILCVNASSRFIVRNLPGGVRWRHPGTVAASPKPLGPQSSMAVDMMAKGGWSFHAPPHMIRNNYCRQFQDRLVLWTRIDHHACHFFYAHFRRKILIDTKTFPTLSPQVLSGDWKASLLTLVSQSTPHLPNMLRPCSVGTISQSFGHLGMEGRLGWFLRVVEPKSSASWKVEDENGWRQGQRSDGSKLLKAIISLGFVCCKSTSVVLEFR